MTDPRVIDTTKLPAVDLNPDESVTITHPSGSTTTITSDGNIKYSASQVGEIDTTKAPILVYDGPGVSPMAPPSPEFIATIQNGVTNLTNTYTAKLEKVDTRVVADAEVFAGLAAHEIWAVTVEENGKWYAAISAYVWRLNEQNTVPANRYLQAKASDSIVIFDHDVKVADFTLPKKAQTLLDKLNA